MAKVTLRTVAERVGVSAMTVSNAFSRPDQLSAPMRERILAAAAELGYVGPDPVARSLARGTSGTVGVLFTQSLREAFTEEVNTAFLAAVTEELAPSGLSLTLLSAVGGPDVVPTRDVAMDGALVYSCHADSPAVGWLRKRGLPLVYVDQAPTPGVPSVNVDDRGGAREAAQHLVDLGHRHVGVLTFTLDPAAAGGVPFDDHVAQQRRRGWLEALDAGGVSHVVAERTSCGVEDGREMAAALLGADDPPTALLCFSDAMAAGALRAAEDLGLRVPQDLSVVGFDDTVARSTRPALTTVHQDVDAKGHASATALVAAIRAHREGTSPRARHLVQSTHLVVRDSTAPPRG